MSALGQKQTYAVHKPMSALHPIATAKADMLQMVMSALPPKADMCGANRHVCFGPIADICKSTGENRKTASRRSPFSRFGRVKPALNPSWLIFIAASQARFQ
jgi:hypothetical protein